MKVSSSNHDEKDNNKKVASSPEEPCTNPYCKYPYHKNKGPPALPPPLAPPTMGGSYGEGATQICYVGQLLGLAYLICLLRFSVCCFVQLPKAC